MGDKIGQRDVIAQLIRMQYTRNEIDFSRGTFRVRGDTIDVFPAEHSELAIRIELFDDEIESLQLFDPLTGRIRQKMPRFTVYPSSHYVTPRDRVLARRRDDQGRAARAARRARQGRASWWRRSGWSSARASTSRCCSEVGHCKGIENYTRHLSGAAPGEPPPTLVDYLPKDALMFLDESHVLIGQLGGMYNGDRARKDHAGRVRLPAAERAGQPAAEVRGVRTQDAPGDLRLGHAGRLRADSTPGQVVEQLVRPTGLIDPAVEVRPATHQVDDVLQEIRERVQGRASAC